MSIPIRPIKKKSPVMSPIAKTPSIPVQVADQIIGLIRNGKIKEGERLPSEEQMTRLLGISRITLREAKKLLEARGYIESQGKGSKYAALPVHGEKSSIEDLVANDQGKIWELLEVRRILDSEAAAMACLNATKSDIKELSALYGSAVSRRLADQSPVTEENAKLYARFFDTLMEATHNTIFAYLRKSVNKILLGAFPYGIMKLSSVKESSKSIIGQIGAIVEAIESHDPGKAKLAMLAHIDYLEKSLRKPA
jgi:GntR family transcriptional regulator, transcriptional repressor for pyruvate dehydrogenase complex